MNKENIYSERWADEKTAAKHLKVKPTTLRRRRWQLGHNSNEVWTKNHGKVLYDLWETDKKIERNI